MGSHVHHFVIEPILSLEKKHLGSLVFYFENDLATDHYILQNIESYASAIGYLFDREVNRNKLVKLAESEKKANSAKSDFLALMSYEIRTSMNGVVGMASLLSDTQLNQEQFEFVDAIQTSADSLLVIIKDMLDFDMLDSDSYQLGMVPFDLISIAENSVNLVISEAQEKKLEVILDYEPTINRHVIGDPVRLRQILVKLLFNAIKLTEEGYIVLNIQQESSESLSRFHFEVTDTGVGIDSRIVDTIFGNLSQKNIDTDKNYVNTDLGLRICQQLVELMDGAISVHNEIGQGSTFKFFITLDEAIGEFHSTESIEFDDTILKNKKLVVIDDNKQSRLMLEKLLSNWVISVDSYSDDSCLPFVFEADSVPDLFLLDYQMPEVSGLDIAKEIRKTYKCDSPILILSSLNLGDIKNDGNYDESLINGILLKPCQNYTLKKEVKRLLGGTDKNILNLNTQNNEDNNCIKQVLNILIVDDNALNRRLCTIILDKTGYSYTEVVNGLEAVQAFDEQYYDVVLMDIEMPVMDGLEAIRQIRAKHNLNQVFIIAQTASAMKGDREKCLEAGADEYLSKPIRKKKLLNILNQINISKPRT